MAAVLGCLVLGTFLFLYGLQSAPDLLRDEATYWIIAHNVATTAEVSLYGKPFLIHPPLFLILEGGVLKLVGGPDDFLYGTLAIRWLSVAFALGTLAMLLALMGAVFGRFAAIMTALLYIMDPFVERMVRRNMLEAAAMFPVVAAIWILTSVRPGDRTRPLLAGLLIGTGLLVKEFTGYVLVVLVVQWLWQPVAGRVLKRAPAGLSGGQTFLAIVSAGAMYALYPLGAFVSGNWNQFAHDKSYQASRFLGFIHDTGLNASHARVGPLTILHINLQQYATSYLLLLVGMLAAIWLCLAARTRAQVLVGLWALIASGWTGFETVHGLAEEQFYYYMLIPVACAVAALIARSVNRARVRGGAFTALSAVLLVGLLGTLLYNTAVWVHYYGTPDNAVTVLRHKLDHSAIPHRTTMIASNEMDSVVFPNFIFRYCGNPNDLRPMGIKYVVMSTKDDYMGFDKLSDRCTRYIHQHGTLIYQTYSSTYWNMQLWRLGPKAKTEAWCRQHIATCSTWAARHGA
jgi:4-amino-4-deoxy-L-arabinose transferase-like glycosyltransferase